MNDTNAWDKFMKSGNIEDYLNYRKEIENSGDVLTSNGNDIFGANDEKSFKRYRNPRGGLWGKR